MNRLFTAFANNEEPSNPPPPATDNDDENKTPPPETPDQNAKSPKRPARPPMQTFAFWFILLFALPMAIYFLGQNDKKDRDELSQSAFEKILTEGRVKKAVRIRENGSTIRYVKGTYLPPVTDAQSADNATPVDYRTEVVYTEELEKLIRANCDNFSTENVSDIWGSLLISILPILILVALIYFLFSRQLQSAGRGALQFGKSRARLMSPTQEQVTFDDVAGCNEAKDEVSEIVAFLKAPERFQQIGGRIPKGVMMVGPPGTGKTLLARAIAGEAKVPFFSISGSDFVEMFVGVGASRVRDMFEEGKRHAPCIIFIDEIDAVGRSRFTGIGGGHDEREQTLNALLAEMDGFEANTGIIVIAATNRPDVLDPALMRPGRFDRRIAVDLPDMEGRTRILEIHTSRVKMKKDTDLQTIAKGTPGFSGADLANLINEAALAAARDGKKEIDLADLEEARDKVRWGRERRSRNIDEHDKKITAFHEAGHTLIGLLTKNTTPVHKVTIIPRGTAYLGATMNLPEKDRYTQSLSEIQAELDVLMGGRLAERLVFDDITSGSAMDLRHATEIARRMVCEWGMSPKLGPLSYGSRSEHIYLGRDITRTEEYSEETARDIDQEIKRIVTEAETRAKKVLTDNRDRLDTLGNALLEKETMTAEEIRNLLDIPADDDEAPKNDTDDETSTTPPADE